MRTNPPPCDVAAAFADMPPATGKCALKLRELVLEVADTVGVAPVEETLKWGEPAYLPGRAGTTVRIGSDRAGGQCRLLVNCRTTLVEDWRRLFGDRLGYDGNRAVVLDPDATLDREALSICIASALTYHQRRR